MHVLSEKTVITRKPHRCHACQRKVEAGVKMSFQVNVFEGDINRWRTCETCTEIVSNHFKWLSDGDGYISEACVADALEKGQTPEQLLEQLNSQIKKSYS